MELGHITADVYNGRKPRKPNRNNPLTRQRKEIGDRLKRQAEDSGEDISTLSLEMLSQNLPEVQRYVLNKGEQPLENPAELALQAYILRTKDVKRISEITGFTPEEAEIVLDEQEYSSFKSGSSEADNFIGPLLSAISNVANKGLNKIVEKKKAAGKKGGVWEFLANATKPQADLQVQSQMETADNTGEKLKIFAADVLSKIKEAEKKKEINKMLPYIIIGVVLLIAVTYAVAKK